MSGDPEDGPHLYAPDVLEKLAEPGWFGRCMSLHYERTAKKWGCTLIMSERRFRDAFESWREDLVRTLDQMEAGTEKLDHFKQAAFLTFWLRRSCPINDIWLASPGSEANDHQKHFVQFGSELCALLAGFSVCLTYEVGTEEFEGVRFTEKFFYEVPMLFKHKNISPQGIYMMFLGLFGQLVHFED